MKYLLLIIMSFALQAKVFTVKSKWSCDRLEMTGKTARLPKAQDLKIRVNSKRDTISIKPDIFNDIDFSNKDSIINSDSCFKNLLTTVNKAIDSYVSNCKSCDLSSVKLQKKFSDKITNSKYFEKSQTLARLPRVYAGHTESITDTNKSLVQKFCSDEKLNSKEILAVTGLNFVYQMSTYISLDKNSFKAECISKLEKLQDRFEIDKLKCSTSACKDINKKIEIRKDVLTKLSKDFEYAQNKEDIQNLSANGFKIADSATEQNILNNAILDKDKCSMNHSIKIGGRYESIYRYDGAVSKLIDTELSGMDQDCVRKIVRNYIRSKELSSKDDIEECQSKYCKDRRSLYHENIVKLMNFSHTKEQIEYFCKSPPKDTDYSTYFDMWNKIDDISMCTELKVGESRPLLDKSTNGVGHYHGLKRISDKKYEATLAIDFTSDDEATNQDMRDRMNECISKTSDYFKSPSGEQMDLKIITGEQNSKLNKDQQLKVVKIGIADKGGYFRSNSKKYAADISCSTITHELLHLMGLVDEYHENTTQALYNSKTKEAYSPHYFPADKNIDDFKKKTAYVECRSHAKENSVMSSQNDLFSEAVKSKVACKCDTQECIKIMKDEKLAKLANFRTPPDFNINKHCTDTTFKKTKLTNSYEYDDQMYKEVSYSDSYLSFVSPDVTFGSRYSEDKNAKVRLNRTVCRCTTEECRDDIAKYKSNIIDMNKYNTRRYCPYGAPSQSDKAEDIASSGEPSFSLDDDGVFTFTTTPSKNSLLMPAHFEKMKWGSCSTKATRYNKCASYAYKLVDFQCTDKPKYCESDEGWLQSTK